MSTVSLYTNGPFIDLCRGRMPSTRRIKAFKLQSVRRLLAGRLRPADAHARVWDRVLLPRISRLFWNSSTGRANDHRRLGPQPGAVPFSDAAPRARRSGSPRHRGVQFAGSLSPRDGVPRGYHEVKTPNLFDVVVEDLRPLGEVPGRTCLRRLRRPADGAKPMNCPAICLLYSLAARTPTAICRSATQSRARSSQGAERHAARAAARAPASPRTTRTSSAPRTRSRTRSPACSSSRSRPTRSFGLDVRSSSQRDPSSGSAPTCCGIAPSRRSPEAANTTALEYHGQRGRRRVLRAEDRYAHDRLARSLVAARHLSARLQLPRAFRPHLHRRRQRRAPAGDDPSRADGLLRAFHRRSCSSTSPASCRRGSRRCRRSCCRSTTAIDRQPFGDGRPRRTVSLDDAYPSIGLCDHHSAIRQHRKRPGTIEAFGDDFDAV